MSTQRYTIATGATQIDITPDPENVDIDYIITFLDTMDHCKETRIKADDEITLKTLCTNYAREVGKDFKSLHFSYQGKPLFLSTVGKKLITQLGMVNCDVILVSYEASFDEDDVVKKITPRNFSRKAKKNRRKGGKKRSGARPVVGVNKLSDKEEHSKAFSQVLKELEPVLKPIRQKLIALTLERTPPKKKSVHRQPQDKPIINPESNGIKPVGKTYFVVLVGEVMNLYKSDKKGGSSVKKQRTRSLHLHGHSSKEVVSTLDEHLIKWIDTAMKGDYPFVIPVAIVCGGNNQIYDIVEKWISSNKSVANAPKNFFQ